MGLPARFTLNNPAWLASLALGCVLIGVAAGVDPIYGVLGAAGLAFAAAVIVDLAAGVALFTVLSYLDLFGGGPTASLTKVAGLFLVISWLARSATRQRRQAASFASSHLWLTVAGVSLLTWSLLSVAWATVPSAALAATERYALDFFLFPVVFAAVWRREHLSWIVAAFVVGAVVSATYGLVHPMAQTSQAGRLTGALGESNQQATVLVAAIALSSGLIGVIRRSTGLKLVTTLGAVLAFIGLVETLSRAGLIALGVVMLGGVAFGGRWRSRAILVLVMGTIVTFGYFAVLAPLTARQRITMSDTSGRSSIWPIGWRMFQANPVIGVGSDNFLTSAVHYLQQPGTITQAKLIVDTPKTASNIYLEALADLGVPGLLTLLAVLCGAIAVALRAAWIFERLGDLQLELMSRALALAVLAFMSADFFASEQYSKQLWLVLALCPAVYGLALRQTPREHTFAEPPKTRHLTWT